jgi:membrane-associated HD superfamily phosphohydrolase
MAEENQVELDLGTEEAVEVEAEAPKEIEEVEVLEADSDDQFKKAEDATQKRINRLTKKMREAERQREEALNYAKNVQAESDQLKQRMESLDNNYVNEFSSRVTSQMEQAEAELSRAIEIGDSAATVAAQRKLTNLAIQADRAEQAKAQQEQQKAQSEAAAQQVPQQAPQQAPRRPDAKAEQWALRNTWFGEDEAMTYAAFGIHKKLVEEEGFDPTSDEYYTELDRRIDDKFNTGAKTTSKRPAQTVAGATRTTSGRSGKKVRLTPSQVAIAKKLGVPLEEYAKHVKE